MTRGDTTRLSGGARGGGSSASRRRPGRPRLSGPSAGYVERRREIVETAARIFRDKGFDAGSLDDVAAELDLRKASLYYYIPSKAHLLYLIFDRAITLALRRLGAIGRIEDARLRLAALITHQVTIVAAEPSLFTVFFDHRPRLDDEYEDEIRDKERHYVRAYAEAVDAAMSAGVVPVLDPRHGAHAMMGMATWLYKWFDPARDDSAAFAAVCVELLLGEPVVVDLDQLAPIDDAPA